MYIDNVFVIKSTKTLRPLMFLAFVSLSLLVGLEQLAYYKASWYDVIAGWLLGGLIAAYLVGGQPPGPSIEPSIRKGVVNLVIICRLRCQEKNVTLTLKMWPFTARFKRERKRFSFLKCF